MKRFTESTKWDDPWFRQLPGAAKLLFLWLVDKCDGAGILDADLGLASFQIGMKISEDTLAALGERVTRLDNGKLMLTKFIKFQHGELSRDCKAHNPVFKSLEANGLLAVDEDGKERVSIPYAKGIQRVQVKVEGKVMVNSGESAERGRGTREELEAFAVEIGQPASDGSAMFDHWSANGWKNGGNASKDWRAGMRNWKAQGWLASQKRTNATHGHKPRHQAYDASAQTAGRTAEEIGTF